MPSPAQLKLIQDLLKLPQIKVIDYTSQENVGMIIKVLANNKAAICPRCSTKSEKLSTWTKFKFTLLVGV